MPSNYTEHYQLNLWAAEDKVQRVDFNADNAKIDAAIQAVAQQADGLSSAKAEQSALNAEIKARADGDSAINTKINTINSTLAAKGNCQIAFGSYTGTGSHGQTYARTLTFPFTPRVVFIQNEAGAMDATQDSSYFDRRWMTLVRPVKEFRMTLGRYPTYVSWSGNSVSWYSPDEDSAQLNAEGRVYHYVAIG